MVKPKKKKSKDELDIIEKLRALGYMD